MSNELCGKYSVKYGGEEAGTLTISQKGLMTVFECQCNYRTDELLKLAIRSDDGLKTIGTMIPEGGKFKLHKKFSKNNLKQLSLNGIEDVLLLTEEELAMPLDMPIFVQKAGDKGEDKAEEEAEADADADVVLNLGRNTTPEQKIKEEPEREKKREIIPEANELADCAVERAIERKPIWRPSEKPQNLFKDDDLRKADIVGALEKSLDNGRMLLAIPFETGEPFPLMPIFCFGQSMNIEGRNYLVFCLKDGELYL